MIRGGWSANRRPRKVTVLGATATPGVRGRCAHAHAHAHAEHANADACARKPRAHAPHRRRRRPRARSALGDARPADEVPHPPLGQLPRSCCPRPSLPSSARRRRRWRRGSARVPVRPGADVAVARCPGPATKRGRVSTTWLQVRGRPPSIGSPECAGMDSSATVGGAHPGHGRTAAGAPATCGDPQRLRQRRPRARAVP